MMTLKAEPREKLGKAAKAVREAGYLPAELYGHNTDNVHVKFLTKDFLKVYEEAGESTIINIDLSGEVYPVIVYGVQYDHLNENIIHVDLYRVNMNETITTDIPLEFIGEAPAVKDHDGVLVVSTDAVEVEALPANLPPEIEIDLSVLKEIGDTLHISDIIKKGEYDILTDPETVIVSISEQQEEESEEEAMTVDDIEVEGEKKEDKGGKEEGGEKEKGKSEKSSQEK